MVEENAAFVAPSQEATEAKKKFRVDILLVVCFIAFLFTFSAYYGDHNNKNHIASGGGLCPAPLVLVDCPCSNTCPPTCQAGCKQPACGCPENTFLHLGQCIPSCSVFKQCEEDATKQQRVVLTPWENSEIFHYRLGPPDFECSGEEEKVSVYLHFTVLKLGMCSVNPPLHYVSYVAGDRDNMQAPKLATAKLVSCLDVPTNTTNTAWYFHVAHLRQLPSDTNILYQVGIKSKKKTSGQWREFTSPLLAGETSTRAVLVFGDTATVGAAVVAPVVAKQIKDFNLALHMGDTSYSTNRGLCYDEPFGLNPSGPCGFDCQAPTECNGAGQSDDEQLVPMQRLYEWSKLLDSTVNGHVSLVSTPGNHDNDAPFTLTYRARWQDMSPKQILTTTRDKRLHIQQQCKQPAFFSHDHGLLHIVTIGTEDNPVNAYEKWDGNPLNRRMIQRFEEHFGINSVQYRWLEADLQRAAQRRSLVPWILVYMHRPMYHTAQHHVWCGKGGDWYGCKFLETYEPLFRKYGVNLALAGHSHHYARSVAMYNNEIDLKSGTVHILVGNAGTELIGDKWHNTPDWLAAREGNKLGYSRFWAHNATSLYWEHVLAEDGDTVMDSVWVENLFL